MIPKKETAGMAWKVGGITSIGVNDWCIDSRAKSPMTADKILFIEYENYNITIGTARDGINLMVVDQGKISCLIIGKFTIFESVLHIPELNSNLLSPGKKSSAGLTVNWGSKQVIISRGKKIVATSPKIDETWVLRAYSTQEQARKADSDVKIGVVLWHWCLGYPVAEKLKLIPLF